MESDASGNEGNSDTNSRMRHAMNLSDGAESDRKRHSSRSRSQSRSRGSKAMAAERSHTPSHRRTQQTEPYHDHKSAAEAGHSSGSKQLARHKRRKRHTREISLDQSNETPITAVLHELGADIQDDIPSLYELEHHTIPGAEDQEAYSGMKNKHNVYVECPGGFSSLRREQALRPQGLSCFSSSESWWSRNVATPLDVAVFAQKLWLPLADFCHGLLAGLALMQTIVVDRLLDRSSTSAKSFLEVYCHVSLTFTTLFYLLNSVCLVTVFDRFDLTHGDWPYLLEVLSARPRVPWLLVLLYSCGLLLSMAAARGDDWIYLSLYNTVTSRNLSNDSIYEEELQPLSSWHVLNSLRCVCVVLGWLVVASSHPPDLLLRRLKSMTSFQTSDSKNKTIIKPDP